MSNQVDTVDWWKAHEADFPIGPTAACLLSSAAVERVYFDKSVSKSHPLKTIIIVLSTMLQCNYLS